jgi:alpha-amylase
MNLRLSRLFTLTTLILSACTASSPSPTLPPAPTSTPQPPTATFSPPTATPIPTAEPVSPVVGLPAGTDGYPWWNDTVFYEVFVRSFYDSNDDGIGDLPGLISKLDHLNDGDPNTTTDLGVTGIWLMPVNPSASYHGYDVTDYYSVNPDYGTNDDFKQLMAEAHKRNIHVIMDFVINHTSNQHPWFQQSRDPKSPYRDWYEWADPAPTTIGWHPDTTGGYYGIFWEGMPDLNYNTPEVTAEIRKVSAFWLNDMGVDGFRIDGAKHLFEQGGATANLDTTKTWFKDFRTYYESIKPDAMTVGEVWESTAIVASYLAQDSFDLAFDFDLARAITLSSGLGNNAQLSMTLANDLRRLPNNRYATFLTNHDQDRTMSVVGDNVAKAKVAAAILLTGPGVPFLYYGEEIGMLGKKPDEDIRLPMQWSAETSGGFSTAAPWRALNADWQTKNVSAQTADNDSLLSYYRSLIAARSNHAALRTGDTYLLETGSRALYAVLRVSIDETILVLVNLSKDEVTDYGLSLIEGPLNGEYESVPIVGEGPFENPVVNGQGGLSGYQPLTRLAPFSTYIIQLNP